MNKFIHLKGILEEDFVNYKKPSMFLITSECDWKCCIENDIPIKSCQNNSLVNQPTIAYSIDTIINHYMNNDITEAIVFGGLEPFLQPFEVVDFIESFREKSSDDIVIYTGFYKKEISCLINELKRYKNIIVKFGRYVPNHDPHYDEVLGIDLVSGNQYAERIS